MAWHLIRVLLRKRHLVLNEIHTDWSDAHRSVVRFLSRDPGSKDNTRVKITMGYDGLVFAKVWKDS